ncbi:MAG: polyprenol phosphomannose-dependent alpha 1,6 mannosyltransferase MptB [Jiangellales bacterium]
MTLQSPRRISAGQSESGWFSVGIPGLLASILLALGALGVGWIAPASPMAGDVVLSAVRDSTAGTALSKLLIIAGTALMLRVWLAAGVTVRTSSVDEARRTGLMALVWGLPFLFVPVLFSRDVFSYIAASRLVPAGINPYREGTGALPSYWRDGADPMWFDSPSPYGPLWTSASSVMYHLTGAEPTSGLLAFRLLALVGVGLLVWFVPRLAQLAGADPGLATWLAVLNPLVLFHFTASAHNDALMAGLLVAGMAMAYQNRPVLAVVLVTAAGAIKAPALLGLAFVGLLWAGAHATWPTVVAAWAKVVAIAVTTLSALTLISGVGWGWVGNLSTPTKVDTWLSPPTAVGRTLGLVLEPLVGASPESVLSVTRTVALVAAAGVVAALLLTRNRRTPVRGLALAMVTVIALGPVLQPWYLLWAVPLVAALRLSRTERHVAVGLTVGLSIYSVANTAATTESAVSLPDGLAAVASVVALVAVVAASRQVRDGVGWMGSRSSRGDRLNGDPGHLEPEVVSPTRT